MVPLADLSVLIRGDYSDLQENLTDAVSSAQTASEQIAAAFGQEDLAEPLIESFTSLSGASEAAGESSRSLADQLEDVGSTLDTTCVTGFNLSEAFKSVSFEALGLGDAVKQSGEDAGVCQLV